MIKKVFIGLPLMMLTAVACSGFPDDRDQAELRQGAVVIESGPQLTDHASHDFIKTEENKIQMNGDNWSELRMKLAMADATPVNILQIGDSHIQADVSSQRVRRLM
ncbi:MAG: hypothetical protein K2F70_00350, partial [Muribaculaceae bacterium]|nr:hypothetical protein [Muribaculaceae bacterium]